MNFNIYCLYTLSNSGFKNRLCNSGKHPLSNKSLTVTAYGLPPYLFIDKEMDINGGVMHDIVEILARYFGFQVKYIASNTWFIYYSNGTVGGALGPASLIQELLDS